MKFIKKPAGSNRLKAIITEFTAGILVVMYVTFLLMPNTVGIVRPDKRIGKMDGWYYEENGEKIKPELPTVIDKVNHGTFVVENTLPEIAYRNAAVAFYSQQQKVKVFLDEEMIYEYPERKLTGDMIPSTWNFIRLPQDSSGKHIRIEISSPYKRFQGKMDSIYYGSYNSLYYGIREWKFPAFFTSLFIGSMGIIMLLISIFLRKFRGYRREETLGILFILVSLWLSGVSQMVYKSVGAEPRHFITMLSALFCNVFFLSYLEQRVEGESQKITRTAFYLSIVSAFGCLILQITGIKDLVETSNYMLMTLILSFIYACWFYGKKILAKEEGYNKGEFICMILILLAGMVEWGHFYSKTWHTFGVCIRGTVLIYTVYLFGYYILEIYGTAQLNRKLSKQLQDSEIQLMMSQIQPHFIYNTLGSIRALIKISPDEAYKMVYDFSNYLRGNIDAIGNQQNILLSEELRHVKSYVNIEKVRFQNQLEVQFDIQEENFYIPPLSVQALVENAIKHGIRKKSGGGCVWIRSYKRGENYIVEVEDNGVGFDLKEKRKKTLWD